jgi:SAM-dependent methyltransferase
VADGKVLNLIDDTCAAALAQGADAAMTRCWSCQQQQLESSRRWPCRQIAAILGALYSACLIAAGAAVAAFGRHRPDALMEDLARIYCQVPEMILHKWIELRSLAARLYRGRGLDLGCGDGVVGGMLARHAGIAELEGVDISGIEESIVRSHGYSAFTSADIQHLPFPDGGFDFVVSICALEHVPDLRNTVLETARILRPGGAFYFTTPMPNYSEALLVCRLLRRLRRDGKAEKFKRFRDIMAMHYHYLSRDEWRALLAEAGFEAIEIEPIFTRRQLLAYDIMNFQAYFLRYYFYEHLSRWVSRSPRFRRAMVWAAARLCAGLAAEVPSWANATHYSIVCRRAAASTSAPAHQG